MRISTLFFGIAFTLNLAGQGAGTAFAKDNESIGAGHLLLQSHQPAQYTGINADGELEALAEVNVSIHQGEVTHFLGTLQVAFRFPMMNPADPKEAKLTRSGLIRQFAKWEQTGFDMNKKPEGVELSFKGAAGGDSAKKERLLKSLTEAHRQHTRDGQEVFVVMDGQTGEYRFNALDLGRPRSPSSPDYSEDMKRAQQTEAIHPDHLLPEDLRNSAQGIFKSARRPGASLAEVREAARLAGDLSMHFRQIHDQEAGEYGVAVGEWQMSGFGEKLLTGEASVEEVIAYAKSLNAGLVKPQALIPELYQNTLAAEQTAGKLRRLLENPEAFLRGQGDIRREKLAQERARAIAEALPEIPGDPDSPEYKLARRTRILDRAGEIKRQRELAQVNVEKWIQERLFYWKKAGTVERVTKLLPILDQLGKNGFARIQSTPEAQPGERPSRWRYQSQLDLLQKHADSLDSLEQVASERAFGSSGAAKPGACLERVAGLIQGH